MQIDLLKANYSDEIKVNEEVVIPKDYYSNMDIESLPKVSVNGNITMNDDGYLVLLDVTGIMMLHDSITYDIIPYEFNIKIEETLEKSLKTLDLIEFLWHYIVLEVPLRFTKSEGNYFENERYRVISEEEYSYKNNPFKDFHVE